MWRVTSVPEQFRRQIFWSSFADIDEDVAITEVVVDAEVDVAITEVDVAITEVVVDAEVVVDIADVFSIDNFFLMITTLKRKKM